MIARLIGASAFLLVCLCCSSDAQSPSEMDLKFGVPVKSYSVSEKTWMSPEFTTDGQLCRARLYPKKIDPTTNYLGSDLSLNEVEAVLNQLAPASVRGLKKEDFGWHVSGSIVFSGFRYEAVRIDFVAAWPSWNSAARNLVREAKEFPGVHAAEVATITWLHRTCGSR